MFEGIDLLRFVLAFIAILALIGGATYLVRRFGATALNAAAAAGRGRQPRLAVIESAGIDGRRRLMLIRRDNVEHLIMIGGPSDVVIEPNIVRAIPSAPAREAPAARMAPTMVDTLPRAVPLAEGGMWPLQPEPPPRPRRAPAPVVEETDWSAEPEPESEPEPQLEPEAELERPPRVVPERAPRAEPSLRAQNPDRLANLAADLSRNFAEPESAPPPRRAAEPRRAASVQPASDRDEQNLAEMAHRLETALHRPRQGSEPAAMRVAEPAHGEAKPARAEPKPAARPEPRLEPRSESRPESRSEPRPESRAEPKSEPKLEPKLEPKPEPKPKPPFDSLEQEMASLLGRPSGKI
jgi:flagellar protein FliO/FliZ